MRRMARSMGFACSGLVHAIRAERNIQRFLAGLLLYVCVGVYLGFWIGEWIIIGLTSACFLIVELLNTALERLADVVDDSEKTRRGGHFHIGIKQAKDVAAAASLVALVIVVLILGFIVSAHLFVPQVTV